MNVFLSSAILLLLVLNVFFFLIILLVIIQDTSLHLGFHSVSYPRSFAYNLEFFLACSPQVCLWRQLQLCEASDYIVLERTYKLDSHALWWQCLIKETLWWYAVFSNVMPSPKEDWQHAFKSLHALHLHSLSSATVEWFLSDTVIR